MSQSSSGFASPPAPPTVEAPPITPGPLGMPSRPAAWPKVMGIVAIVMAALWILSSIWSLFTTLAIDSFSPNTGTSYEFLQSQIVKKWLVYTLISNGVTLALSALLLVWGIKMINRRLSSIMWARIWSWLCLIFTLVGGAFTYVIMNESFDEMMRLTSMPTTGPAATGARIGAVFGGVCGSLMVAAYPAFVLIWLAQPKVKAEVSTWSRA